MTLADELRAAGQADDEATVRALLVGRSEADRAELIPVAREIVSAQTKKGLGAVGHLAPMLLIAYGVLAVSDIRKLGWRSNHLPKGLEDVLRGRSAERLVPIAEFLLDDVNAWAWGVVRPLVRDGSIPRPDRPSYTIALLAATRYRDAAEMTAADPALLEHEVWRLFEVEGGGEDSLANHEKFYGDTWGNHFRGLAAHDPAIRRRLLDLSLAALARDFAAYRAGWFSRFHESLGPTNEERAERADAYLGLLRSRVGPTVSLAINALDGIARVGRLDPDALLDRIGPVLSEGSAGTAKVSLGLVGQAGDRSADMGRRASMVATEAIANASPEIQGRAIALIGRLFEPPDDGLARALAGRLPDVAASQRSALTSLIARSGGDTASAAASTPSNPGAVAVHVERPSPIDPDRAIVPIETIEALVDLAVSVVESGEPADDVERVFDAVGRMADRPEARSRLTSSVGRRARTILGRRESRPFCGFDVRADVAAILLAWATGELVDAAPASGGIDPGSGAFLAARTRERAAVAAAGRSFHSVAAPTHRGGWIDPNVLVRRLAARPPASHLDLVAAILRLAPVGRQEALAAAADVAGEAGSAVRYALGGDEAIGPTAAWWVAAARVRSPGRDDPTVERRHPGLGPGAGMTAQIRLMVTDPKRSVGGLRLEIGPPLPAATSVDLPTVLLLRTTGSFWATGRSDPAMLRWMATIQPGDREPWAAIGGLTLGRNTDWWSAEWANRAFLEPFIDPATEIGPHARGMIGIALGAKEAGERGLATDVVRLALADRRLTASTLADGLAAAAAVSCDRSNRWAHALADVAADSTSHAEAVAEAVARSLPELAGRPPAKLVPLLRLLDELLAGTGGAATATGRRALEGLAATRGEAGRLARSILARG